MTMASRTINRRASRGRRRLLAAWGMMLAAATLPPLEEPALATAADPRLAKIEARALRDAADGQRAAVMIVLSEQADLREAQKQKNASARGAQVYQALTAVADRTQSPIVELLRRRALPYQRFFVANIIAASVDYDTLLALAARQDVRAIEANLEQPWIEPPALAERTLTPTYLTPAGVEWGVQNVNAPQVWERGAFGQGIVVADADTGLQWDHPALKGHYRGWNGIVADHNYSWHDAIHEGTGNPCGVNTQAPCDDQGHGTHTAGTTVGDDGLGNRIGVAPGARLIACRNMDRGAGTPARYTECFQFFIAPTDLQGKNPNPDLRPHVINNSWGCTGGEGCAPTTLQLIVENTQAAGIFVEASAGNSGSGCGSVSDGPALFAAAFSTGAHDSANKLAAFSSRGPVTADGSRRPKPELTAPGVRVRSSLRGSVYGQLNGTSMAGPHVVGVVALLWSARPELVRDIDATKALLKASARPDVGLRGVETCGGLPSDFVPNNTFGYGRVDALRAVTW
jgi:subtilisin family serine protease